MKQTCPRRKYSAAFKKVRKLDKLLHSLVAFWWALASALQKVEVWEMQLVCITQLLLLSIPFYVLCNTVWQTWFLTPALSLPSTQGMFVYVHLIWQQDNQSPWPLDSTSQELKLWQHRFPAKAKAEAGNGRIHQRISLKPWPPNSLPVKHHLCRQPQSQLLTKIVL